jgi:hypothetical protein
VLTEWQSFKSYFATHLILGELSYSIVPGREGKMRVKIIGLDVDLDFLMHKDDPIAEEIMDFVINNEAKRIETTSRL